MRSSVTVGLGLVALAVLGCTAFEGVEPGGGAGGKGAGGGGGEGGTATNCLAESPSCLLPPLEAHKLCSRIAACPTLSTAITLSTGLPVAEADASGKRVAFNYSACVEWLSGPLEQSHAGFSTIQHVLNCVAATADCDSAGACLSYYPLPDGDDRCDTETGKRCEAETLIDCDARMVTNCAGASFPVATRCEVGADGSPTCRIRSCTNDSTTCEENQPGEAVAITCLAADERGVFCPAYNLGCADGVGCATGNMAGSCATPFAQACKSSDTVETCAAKAGDGTFIGAPIACGATGRTCLAEGQTARCVAAGAECSPYGAGINVCDTDVPGVLHVCLQGKRVDFNCGELGFTCLNPQGAEISGRCGT